MATLRPFKGWLSRFSSLILFRIGIWAAAHSIFRTPSGARSGDRKVDIFTFEVYEEFSLISFSSIVILLEIYCITGDALSVDS